MKIFLLILFSGAVCVHAAGTENKKQNPLTQQQAEALARQMVIPAVAVSTRAISSVQDSLKTAKAADLALWDLLNGLLVKMKAGKKKLRPDKALIETYLRLRMRGNTGELVWKGVTASKTRLYPEDRNFEAAAGEAELALTGYLSSLKSGKYPSQKYHKTAIERLLDTVRKKIIFRRPYGPDGSQPEPTPPAPGETSYLEKAGGHAAPAWE